MDDEEDDSYRSRVNVEHDGPWTWTQTVVLRKHSNGWI